MNNSAYLGQIVLLRIKMSLGENKSQRQKTELSARFFPSFNC
ncbi:hypothetical protein VCRA2122O265_230026 [Vibrio crassostreae]|nr:hypothetical protein VCRA2113O207_240026 [Vibrio crassostreae]CAK1914760.1 hypothetical protein VCRA2113O213_220026 [Vibrio crassostreae]CAK1918351.1 hypothetical protein VCRA2113O197_220026 [Vibrio crassostreae]CAK1919380.1 hypothetical protein VCRA2110O173_240026 [Vibrio crassostreae]CAK1923453.1 hypothetical protein VCRA2113O202_220026 [Vibrio crassostreae]